jgi:hypothetical protein
MATVLKNEYEEDIRELGDSEAKAMFEAAVQKRLGMSTEEFLTKLDAGEFTKDCEDPKITRLLSLLPLVR